MKSKKIFKKILVILNIFFNQKNYKINKSNIKYIFEKQQKSDFLVIVFSGFPPKNKRARYNYISTLKEIRVNKLYILDNLGYEKKGTYYLGNNYNSTLTDDIVNFIRHIKEKNEISKIITCGSSKGGYAALYYGIRCKSDFVISGAQQYFIGDYLNNDVHKNILSGMIGEIDSNKIRVLNNVLKNTITNSVIKPYVYLHYSFNEHTYNEHIKYLIEDLQINNYEVSFDIKDYTQHSDVALHFPIYLKKVICELMKKEKKYD